MAFCRGRFFPALVQEILLWGPRLPHSRIHMPFAGISGLIPEVDSAPHVKLLAPTGRICSGAFLGYEVAIFLCDAVRRWSL